MSDVADPWAEPSVPALMFQVQYRPEIVPIGGPDRIYDNEGADPNWRPRPVGFKPPETEPLTWEGDNA